MRLFAPLSAAVEKRSERFSLRPRLHAGDLVAGFVSGRNGFVAYGVVIVEEHLDDDAEETINLPPR